MRGTVACCGSRPKAPFHIVLLSQHAVPETLIDRCCGRMRNREGLFPKRGNPACGHRRCTVGRGWRQADEAVDPHADIAHHCVDRACRQGDVAHHGKLSLVDVDRPVRYRLPVCLAIRLEGRNRSADSRDTLAHRSPALTTLISTPWSELNVPLVCRSKRW